MNSFMPRSVTRRGPRSKYDNVKWWPHEPQKEKCVMNINEARLISYVSAQTNHEFDVWELERMMGYVKACQPEPEVREVVKEVPVKAEYIVDLLQVIKKGEKINAIKAVRMIS